MSTAKNRKVSSLVELAPGVSIAGLYAGMAIVDDNDRIVLIKRGGAPAKGVWSLPAGYVEPNETPDQAAIREVKEETCLDVVIEKLIGEYEGKGFRLLIFAGRALGGSLMAGDDADAAMYFELERVPLTQDDVGGVPSEQSWALEMNNRVLSDTVKHYQSLHS